MASTNYDIFISHKHTEWPFARSLFSSLSSKGYSCWYDADGMHSGNIEQIFQYIDTAKDVIVIINKGNLKNAKTTAWQDDFFCREVAYAIEKKKNIIPILLTEAKYLPKAHDLQSPLQSIWQYKYLTCISSDSYDGLVHYTLVKNGFLKSEPLNNEYIQLDRRERVISKFALFAYKFGLILQALIICMLLVMYTRMSHNLINERYQINNEQYIEIKNIKEQIQQTQDSIYLINEQSNRLQKSSHRAALKDNK